MRAGTPEPVPARRRRRLDSAGGGTGSPGEHLPTQQVVRTDPGVLPPLCRRRQTLVLGGEHLPRAQVLPRNSALIGHGFPPGQPGCAATAMKD
jgi:hypothetical protein